MPIKLTNTEKIKSLLFLQFEGICGKGSLGNNDANFIIDSCRKEILKEKNIQGLILDFSKMSYEFGNRFANIFDANKYINNRQIYIRIIPNKEDVKYWNSLIQLYGYTKINYIQKDCSSAIKSINQQMNNGII